MAELRNYQSLWALTGLAKPQQPPEALLERISAAGYEGCNIDFAANREYMTAACRAVPASGLECYVTTMPASFDELRRDLEAAAVANPRFINCLAAMMTETVASDADVTNRILEIGDEAGLAVVFETHRYTMTNDLLWTLQLLEAVPRLSLMLDLSHYVVARELFLPLDDRHTRWLERLFDRCEHVQGRVSTNEQIQIPLGVSRYQAWYDFYTLMWERFMERWLQRHADEDDPILTHCLELGPEYALAGPDGREFSDRWQEALTLRAHVEGIWTRLNMDVSGPRS